MEEENEQMKINELIAHLENCQQNCLNTVMHSIEKDGDLVRTDPMVILMDCEEVCRTAKNFFLRNSQYTGDLLDLCASICEDCAESCRTFFEDEVMNKCALSCDNCAKACRDLIEDDIAEIENE